MNILEGLASVGGEKPSTANREVARQLKRKQLLQRRIN